MNKLGITLLILSLILIVIGIVWEIVDMLIDNECYQLEPNDYYKSSICERYWRDK